MASRSRSYSKCFPYPCNRRITILIGKLIFTSIVFGISIYINWSYIKMLERAKCDCSKGFIRNYIKYIPIVGYIISVIMHIIITFKLRKLSKFAGILIFINVFLLTLTSHLYVYYFDKISFKKCGCALDWKLNFIWLKGFILRIIPAIFILIVAYIGTNISINSPEFVLEGVKYMKLRQQQKKLYKK